LRFQEKDTSLNQILMHSKSKQDNQVLHWK